MMKFRPWKVACWIALLSGLGLLSAQGADTPGKPAVPDVNLSASLTNVSRLSPKRDGLKQLEEELSKSLQPFSPRGSLDTILGPQFVAPPVPAPLPSRRVKREGQRGNWSFDRPDDPASLGQDPFGTGAGLRGQTSFEQLYKSLGQQPGAGSGSRQVNAPDSLPGSRPFDDLDDENLKLPSGLRESAKSLREKLTDGNSILNQDPGRSSLSDLFAPDRNGPSRDEIQAHKEYIGRFREMLNGSAPKPGELQNPFGSFLGGAGASPSTPAYSAPNPLGPTLQRDTFASTPAGVESVLHPHALPDVNERVLTRWNPLYAAPTVEPSRPVPFASPVVEAPRRRF